MTRGAPLCAGKENNVSELPSWLEPLAEAVASAMTVHGPEGSLGLRYRFRDNRWDVQIYPLPVEMVGGSHDGGLAAPGFSLDLRAVTAAFDWAGELGWDPHGTRPENADAGPCFWVNGEFAGRDVWLRVLAYAPEEVAPAAKVDASGRRQAG